MAYADLRDFIAALDRARARGGEAGLASETLSGELNQIEEGNAQLIADQSCWIEARAERKVQRQEPEPRQRRSPRPTAKLDPNA